MASIITSEIWDHCRKFYDLDVHGEEGLYSQLVHMCSTKPDCDLKEFSLNLTSAMAFIEKKTGYFIGPHSYDYDPYVEATAIVTFYNPSLFMNHVPF